MEGMGFNGFDLKWSGLSPRKKKNSESHLWFANPVLIQKIESGWLSLLADKSQKAPSILIFGSKTIHLRWKVLTPMPSLIF